jgi:hypothetical protein
MLEQAQFAPMADAAARLIAYSPLAEEEIEVQVCASMAASLRISATTFLIGCVN